MNGATLVLVEIVAIVLVMLFTVLIVGGVLAMFVWAAIKDGEDDRAFQKSLGIRRRTRLGR